MNAHWFKRSGMFFLPRSIAGWLIFGAAIATSVYRFIRIDSRSHSASDTLINFFFEALIIAAVYSLVAYLDSRLNNR